MTKHLAGKTGSKSSCFTVGKEKEKTNILKRLNWEKKPKPNKHTGGWAIDSEPGEVDDATAGRELASEFPFFLLD